MSETRRRYERSGPNYSQEFLITVDEDGKIYSSGTPDDLDAQIAGQILYGTVDRSLHPLELVRAEDDEEDTDDAPDEISDWDESEDEE